MYHQKRDSTSMALSLDFLIVLLKLYLSIGDTEYAYEVLETFGLKVDSFFLFWGRGKMDTLLSILLITILGGVKLLSILPISNFLGW